MLFDNKSICMAVNVGQFHHRKSRVDHQKGDAN